MNGKTPAPKSRCTRAACVLSIVWLAAAQAPQTAREAGKLQLHQPVERELGPGRKDLFTVEVAAGQFVSVVVRKKGVDAALSLADASGKTLAAADGPSSTTGPVPASWIAEAPGNYTIVVTKSARSVETGKYEVELVGLRQPTATDRTQIQAEAKFQAALGKDRAGDRDSRLAAIQLYEEAASLWRGLNDGYQEAICVHSIGVLYSALGQTQRALEYHQRALPIWRAIGDRAGEAGSLNSMGVVYNNLGDNQKAMDFLQQALAIRRAIADRSGESKTLHNMGLVYSELSEQQKALDCYWQSADIKHAIGDRLGEADNLISVGVVYTRRGDQQKALEYFQQALPRGFEDPYYWAAFTLQGEWR